MPEPIFYRLSSVDQATPRTYIRCCYCFPCGNEEVHNVIEGLGQSTRQAIKRYPLLACSVTAETTTTPSRTSPNPRPYHRRETISTRQRLPASLHARRESTGSNTFTLLQIREQGDHSDAAHHQAGRLDVVATSNNEDFMPLVKHLTSDEFPKTYAELAAQEFSPTALVGTVLTPLPDIPDPAQGLNPVFAVQANFINGGVLVVIFLHHTVGDVRDLARVVRCMSNGTGNTSVNELSVEADAIEQSRSRDRLSGSRGVKARSVRQAGYEGHDDRPSSPSGSSVAPIGRSSQIFAFDLNKIQLTTEMINERSALNLEAPYAQITALDCVVSILWKAITRAHCHGTKLQKDHISTLHMPVNMRMAVDPPLGSDYFGNACIFAKAHAQLIRLGLPFDVGTLSSTAHAIRERTIALTEIELRAGIALINDLPDVRSATDSHIDGDMDLRITDWSGLPTGEDAALNLGLGPPQCVREVSREQSSRDCIVLPQKHKEAIWEVVVKVGNETLAHMLENVGLMPFVVHVV